MNTIAASGAAYGIYMIFTANTELGLSYKFTQLIKGTIALQQREKGDYAQLVGSVNGISLPNFPGRGLIKGNPPVAFQAAVYAGARKDQERHNQVLKLLKKMEEAWKLIKVQESARSQELQENSQQEMEEKEAFHYESRAEIPVGRFMDNMEQAKLDLSQNYHCLICSESSDKSLEFMDRLEKVLRRKKENQIIILDQDNYRERMNSIISNLNDRQRSRKQHREEKGFDELEWIRSYMQICILIQDLPGLVNVMTSEEEIRLRRIYSKSEGLGVIILACGTREKLQKMTENLVIHKALNTHCVVIAEGNPVEYTIFNYEDTPVYADTLMDAEEAVLIQNGKLRFIRYS